MTKTVMIQLTEEERDVILEALDVYEGWLTEWEEVLMCRGLYA